MNFILCLNTFAVIKFVSRLIKIWCTIFMSSCSQKVTMSMFDYFSKKTLPNSKGSLSHSIPACAIAHTDEKWRKPRALQN